MATSEDGLAKVSLIAPGLGGGSGKKGAQGLASSIAASAASFTGPVDVNSENVLDFQFFPESVSDEKEVNWSEREIPGGSHPIYQFVSGGARTISFEAVLYREAKTDQHRSVESQVNWLRQHLYPKYGKKDGREVKVTPPDILKLSFPGNMKVSPNGSNLTSIVRVIMNQCNVTYEKWFEDGTPRIATVSLTFLEVVQSAEGIQFQGREGFENSDVVPRSITKRQIPK